MTDEYTPTTEDMRSAWQAFVGMERNTRPEFDRWLATHDREVAVKTLREAAQIVEDTARQGLGLATAAVRLRGEADRIDRLEQSND